MIKAIIEPDLYHGNEHKSNFFEGWYFKIEHPSQKLTYCFIPGIFMAGNKEEHHSFIQVINGSGVSFKYIKFPKEAFKASNDKFSINIGKSSFSLNKIVLDINGDGEKIFGSLSFRNIMKWPDNIINPGSMGFYNYFTFMQCYTQVCAMNGFVEGTLNVNGKEIDFTGGKVYIEKNWGSAFPDSYIWVQGNCFKKSRAAVTCSIGEIPFLAASFTGFLIGIYVEEEFYKFTTINRSRLSIEYEKTKLILRAYNKKLSLEIAAEYDNKEFMDLYAPRHGNMVPIATETLQAKIKVTLYDHTEKVIFSDFSENAGVEFAGQYKTLAMH